MANERKISEQLMTSIVNGLLDAGHTVEAKHLTSTKSTQEFDALCAEYCAKAEPAGVTIEQIMFLFYDWEENGDDEAAIAQFKVEYGMHPAQSRATARFYWSYLASVIAEWKYSFPELFTRFHSDDVRRIPWVLKLLYSVTLNDLTYTPVPEYGAPLKAIVRQVGARDGKKAVVDHIPEGITIKEYEEKKVAAQRMDLFGKKPGEQPPKPTT